MADKYQPPSGAAGNAKKVLRWREEHGDEVKGMTRTGWVRARQLASGEPVSADIVKRMASFNRHRKNAAVNPEFKSTPWKDKGYVAWLGWGGDTGINWAIETAKRINKPKAELEAKQMEQIEIYGDVETGIAEGLRERLPDGPVTVRINSDGGSVREGLAIYNILKEHPHEVTTVIDGGAFSIAAYIAMAGDKREISENGMLMVHGARSETFGNVSQHEQTVEMLKTADAAMKKAFIEATGKTPEDVSAMLAVDTWLDADQALAEGFVTEITKKQTLEAFAFSDSILNRMPPRLVAKLNNTEIEKMATPKAATYQELKAISSDKDFIVAMLETEATVEEAEAEKMKAMEEKADLAEALEEENKELKAMLKEAEAKLSAMEEEKEEVSAGYEVEAMEEEEEEKQIVIKAKSGNSPVANASGRPQATAAEQWQNAIEKELNKGRSRADAVRFANRRNPGLRAAYLAEIN